MMSIDEFAEACIGYNKENNITLDIKKPTDCPVHQYAAQINKMTCKATVSGIKKCLLCGANCCPVCDSHNNVIPLSRVTGYIQSVDGFNSGKKQELKDRKRYILEKHIT